MRKVFLFFFITLLFSCEGDKATSVEVAKATATRELSFLNPSEIVCKASRGGCMHESSAYCRIYTPAGLRYIAYCGEVSCYNIELDMGKY